MDITKYSHACFSVTKAGETLIVDPGSWTHDLTIADTVIGIVVTHEHTDHCDRTSLRQIIDANPAAVIYAPDDVTTQLSGLPVQSVSAGEILQVGEFTLEFVGGTHAEIDTAMPPLANLGVIIDNFLYYPGDSFSLPGREVDTVAVPAAAPWMRFSDAAAFLRTVRPKTAFPTHDAILSNEGKQLADTMLGAVCREIGTAYRRLN